MTVKRYKGKGEAKLKGDYRELRLLEQVMREVETVFEKLLCRVP